jgi:hypothetical protein
MCQHCCSKVITLNIESKIKFIQARLLDLKKIAKIVTQHVTRHLVFDTHITVM